MADNTTLLFSHPLDAALRKRPPLCSVYSPGLTCRTSQRRAGVPSSVCASRPPPAVPPPPLSSLAGHAVAREWMRTSEFTSSAGKVVAATTGAPRQ